MEFPDLTMWCKFLTWIDENKIFLIYWAYRFAYLFRVPKKNLSGKGMENNETWNDGQRNRSTTTNPNDGGH